MSAVRNLNGTDVGGRPLRIDLADSDPFLEGKTTVRGELVDSSPDSRWREREREFDDRRVLPRSQDPNAFLSSLPPGIQVPPGSTALDTISQNLATMNPGQLMEVLAQMKAFIITHPEEAKILLVAHPQLAYALFQALLLNNIVDHAILQRMLNATSASATAAHPPAPQIQAYSQPSAPVQHPPALMSHPSQQPTPPVPQQNLFQQPQPSHLPPQQSQPYYRQPAPSALATPTTQPPQDLNIDSAHQQMLYQVLQLSPDQISALPAAERDAIQQLRNQFMNGAIAV